MNRRTWYELIGMSAFAAAGAAAVLAVVGAALIRPLNTAAAALCAAVFFIPGLYLLAYARQLGVRDAALAHAASFATARGTIEMRDLAAELAISNDDAEKILRTAIREGHLHGRFDDRGRFTVESTAAESGGIRP